MLVPNGSCSLFRFVKKFFVSDPFCILLCCTYINMDTTKDIIGGYHICISYIISCIQYVSILHHVGLEAEDRANPLFDHVGPAHRSPRCFMSKPSLCESRKPCRLCKLIGFPGMARKRSTANYLKAFTQSVLLSFRRVFANSQRKP